jgi:hypothetical protein
MNQQLKLIAEQAGLQDFVLEAMGIGEEVENFARLIVQECAEVCLTQRDPTNLNYKPSERFAEAVKQHFGVK